MVCPHKTYQNFLNISNQKTFGKLQKIFRIFLNPCLEELLLLFLQNNHE